MANLDKYRRVKLMGHMLITTKKKGKIEGSNETEKSDGGQKELIVSIKSKSYVILVIIVSFMDLLKNSYLMMLPMSSGRHLLYGDIIISLREDQRLYNFSIIIVYATTMVQYYFTIYGKQRAVFYELSKFLYALPPREYSRKFLVTRKFAERFVRWLDRGVLAQRLVCNSYLTFTFSFYGKCLYQVIVLGFSWEQILCLTCPCILIGAFALVNFYLVALQGYWLFIIYVRLMKGRFSRLTADLDRLNDGHQRKLARHLADLDRITTEYKVSKEYFQITMLSPIPAVLVTMAQFPTNIVFSENLFTNQLVLMFMVNVFCVLLPIVHSNEVWKRGLDLYLNAIHRFMPRTRDLRIKLKLMKVLDTWQKTSHISYTLLNGVFDLELEHVPTILAEIFALTFLMYPFIYYSTESE